MSLEQAQRIFFHGIGGMGMRGLAHLLAAAGKTIMGTDSDITKLSQDPDFDTYTIAPEETAGDLLARSDILIYSDAVPTNHPLRHVAAQRNLPALMLFQAIGELSREYTTIAIAGTHGKSSTTALLAHLMIAANLDPTVLVGASIPAWQGRNARTGKGAYFIVEADEYRDHFLSLAPTHAIVTTIDFDHPDYFASLAEVLTSFQKFIDAVSPQGTIITSETTYQHARDLTWPSATQVVPITPQALPLMLPGQHMQHNAQLAIALAQQLGVSPQKAAASLTSFTGISRRFEQLGRYRTMDIISDYGHHPAEIAATLRAARERYPNQKILTIIEPHTDERLRALLPQFTQVLTSAPIDGVLIAPVFRAPGRQVDAPVTVAEMRTQFDRILLPLHYLETYDQLTETLDELSQSYDVALAFSAGVLDNELRQLVVPNSPSYDT